MTITRWTPQDCTSQGHSPEDHINPAEVESAEEFGDYWYRMEKGGYGDE